MELGVAHAAAPTHAVAAPRCAASRRAAPSLRCAAVRRRHARVAPRAAAGGAAALQRGAAGGAGGSAVGEYVCPTLLNNCPHPREVRQHFYDELTASVVAAVRDGKTRLRTFQEFPELNVEMDVYRIGTLLEGVRELVAALTADGKRVRVCVQGSMGAGAFTAMPLQLAGVARILRAMDWGGDAEPGNLVRLGALDDVAEDDDVFLVIAPQNITGYSVLPGLRALCEAAGARPVVLLNPRLVDIPSANNVMQVRGREERLAFAASFEEVFHFRLIYNKPYHFPIYGCLRHAFGGPWELYKRTGRAEEEAYRFVQAFPQEPDRDEITDGIARNV